MKTQHAPRLIGLLVAAAIGMAVMAAPSQAVAPPDDVALAQDIIAGTYTQAELTSCAGDSGCTDLLYGTTTAFDGTGTSESLTQASADLAAQGDTATALRSGDCPSGSTPYFTSRYWTQKGTLGNVNYRWHWGVWFCRNNNKNTITKYIRKASWLTDAAWFVDLKEVVATNMSGLPTSTATAFREQHVQLNLVTSFVPINFYPWGRYKLHGDGSPAGVDGSSR